MEYNGKTFKIIIWDWLWTLYSPLKKELYEWVREYFNTYGKETENYLVSFAVNPEKRLMLIQSFEADKWFKHISTNKYKDGKVAAFKELIEKFNLNKDEILVVGDNINEEIHAARELGLANMPIADWSEFITDKLRTGSEKGKEVNPFIGETI